MMSPASHGTGFIALYNIFKDGKNVRNYITRDFKIDSFTYFVILMNQNKIKIKEVTNAKYHFIQIPGWGFVIEYLNRKDLNSGWLITELFRLSYMKKERYKIEQLNIFQAD